MHRPKVYFMAGIGGMGMLPLALYLKQQGHVVFGFDNNCVTLGVLSQYLDPAGIVCMPYLPDGVDVFVYSSAIGPDHDLYKEAVSRGLPRLRRGDCWADCVTNKSLIAVVGSHGKTTTTAMAVDIVQKSGLDCGYYIGGLFNNTAYLPGRATDQPWVIAEIDESDGTVEAFSPEVTVAVNFDWDHSDRYVTVESLEATFGRLFARTKRCIVIPDTDEKLLAIAKCYAQVPVICVGEQGDLRTHVQSLGEGQYRVIFGESEAVILGYFNALNASLAMAIGHVLGLPLPKVCLSDYPGVMRRQDVLYLDDKNCVVADYAHHPTELMAVLDMLYAKYSTFSTVIVFQPHRYTRTRQYARAFAQVLGHLSADKIILMPVYPASEAYLEDGTTDKIFQAMDTKTQARTIQADAQGVLEALGTINDRPSLVAFLGAGDIDQVAAIYAKTVAMRTLKQQLSPDTKYTEYEPLANKTTLGVGGCARWYIEPANEEDLQMALRKARVCGVKVFVLGRGSNVLVLDNGYDGLVVRLHSVFWRTFDILDDARLFVRGGVRLKEITGKTTELGWTGFEFMEGIPGSLGGSLCMNAGAMGGWMFDRVEQVVFMTLDGTVHRYDKSQCEVGYRHCKTLKGTVVLGAILRKAGDDTPQAIRERIDTYAKKRKSTQPREASAGCAFKNPPEGPAGKLIDLAGLKGLHLGQAMVSDVHGNFLINRGHARSADVVSLIEAVKQAVFEKHGVILEQEIVMVGEQTSGIRSIV